MPDWIVPALLALNLLLLVVLLLRRPDSAAADRLERLERELLFEEARRTLKSAPRFAERTAPPRRPRTP